MCMRSVCQLLAGVAVGFAAARARAATVIVPTDQSTVQAAVTAAGADGTVIINSNTTFNETVTVTQSVTIHSGVGFTPTIQGTGTCGLPGTYCTLVFAPNGATAQMLSVSGLRLLPGGAKGTSSEVVRVLNRGTGEATAVFSGCTIENPQNFGFLAVNIHRNSCSAGLTHVAFQNGSITITGETDEIAGEGGFSMNEGGSLTVLNTHLAMSGIPGLAFDIRAEPGCGGLDFALSYSTLSIAAPAHESARVALLRLGVTATIEHNLFQLSPASGIGAFGDGQLPYSSSLTLDANRFVGSGPEVGYALQVAPDSQGFVLVKATNNAVQGMLSGFQLGQPVGDLAGDVSATLVNNTVDGSLSDGIALNAANGSILMATAENNLVTNSSGWGLSLSTEAGGSSTVGVDYNGFFNNAAGDVEAPLVSGPDGVVGDPIYVNRPNGDLRLGIGSPMIDAGRNALVSTATDAAGAPRTQNATVDIGAFEGGFVVTAPTNTPSATPSVTYTPTPPPSDTGTPTRTRTLTPSATSTASQTAPPTRTVAVATPTATATHAPTAASTATMTHERTPTRTREPTSSPPMTVTAGATSTLPPSATATRTATNPPGFTATPTPPATALASHTPTSTLSPCVGDCSGSGAVSIADLIVGVNIALDNRPPADCPAFENAQGVVDIAQLITGVNNALHGCGGG